MGIKYGQRISWTTFRGDQVSVESRDMATEKAAREEAVKSARLLGWEPPRWWQWWRRHDTRIYDGE